jgi:glycosyltransferase involved in cell wall biosynthesis
VTSGIRWLAYGPGSGYGDASVAHLTGLREAGVPVTWTPLGWPSTRWPGALFGPVEATDPSLEVSVQGDIANLEIEHDTVVVSSTPFWHDELGREAAGRHLVAHSTWETDLLPGSFVGILNRYDAVLVPSRHDEAVFAASGVTRPVRVVPHSVRRESAPRPRPDDDRFVFYVVATWTTRKAILDTVLAFAEAFSDADPVSLVLHTTAEDLIARRRIEAGELPAGPRAGATWFTLANALAGRERLPDIRLSTRKLSAAGVEALHDRCHCLVSLSRGEGWGLAAFDALAAGNPVVVVRWGGHCDFVPADYPYCAAYELVDTATDPPDVWTRAEPVGRWARVDRGHAASLLREVFEHRDEARGWGEELSRRVRREFSRRRVTATLLDSLPGAGTPTTQSTRPSATSRDRQAATSPSGGSSRP